MSKTIEDLEAIYHAAYREDYDTRAGIIAVVTALRDEFADAYERGFDDATSEDWGSPRKHRSNYACAESIINEILGDAEEKAAGGSTREDGPGGVEQAVPALTPAAAPVTIKETIAGTVLRMENGTGGAFGGLMDGLAKACAPAAAPDVCEWPIRSKSTVYLMACDRTRRPIGLYDEWKDVGRCPECKRPIKFVEAAHEY